SGGNRVCTRRALPAASSSRTISRMKSSGRGASVVGVVGSDIPAILAARGGSPALHRDGRGARIARRDDQEYREYLREEQRGEAGCSARRMQRDLHHGLLGDPTGLELRRRQESPGASSGTPRTPPCFITRGTRWIGSAGGSSAAVVTSRSRRRRALTSTRLSSDPAASLKATTAPSSFRRSSSYRSAKMANRS